MAVNVGSLLATLGLDVSAFTKGAADATSKLKGLEGNFGSLGGFAKTAGVTLAALGAAAAGAAATAFALTKQVANQGDELFKLSQRIGISVEKLSGFRVVAELSDLSIQEFGQSMALLSRRMNDASQGQIEAADAFRSLGISVTDTTGKLRPVDEIMLEIAEKFAGAEDGAGKTALAMELMGRSGAKMIPFMNAGTKGIGELVDEAGRLGVIWNTDAARAAETFNDSLTKVGLAVEGVKLAIFQGAIPAMTPYIDALKEWIAANREIIASQIREYLQSLVVAAKDIAPLVLQLAAGFASIVPILAQIVRGGAAFVELVIAGLAGAVGVIAQSVAGLLGLAAKIPGIGGAFVGVAADAQDIANTITFMGEEAGKGFERLVSGSSEASVAQRSLTATTQQETKKRGTLAVQESDQQRKAREAAEKAIAELRISIIGDSETKILAEREAALRQAKRQYDEDLRAFGQTAQGKQVAQERFEDTKLAIGVQTDQKLRAALAEQAAKELAIEQAMWAKGVDSFEEAERLRLEIVEADAFEILEIRRKEAEEADKIYVQGTDAFEEAERLRLETVTITERDIINEQSRAFLETKRLYDDDVTAAINANLLKLNLYKDEGTKQVAIAAGTYRALEADQRQNLENAVLALRQQAEANKDLWAAIQAGALKTHSDLGTFWGNVTKGFEQTFMEVNRTTSDLFFDAMTGNLKSLSEYFEDFGKRILRIFSDILAAEVTKGFLSLFGIGTGSGGGITISGTGAGGGGGAAGGLGILSSVGSLLNTVTGGAVSSTIASAIGSIGSALGLTAAVTSTPAAVATGFGSLVGIEGATTAASLSAGAGAGAGAGTAAGASGFLAAAAPFAALAAPFAIKGIVDTFFPDTGERQLIDAAQQRAAFLQANPEALAGSVAWFKFLAGEGPRVLRPFEEGNRSGAIETRALEMLGYGELLSRYLVYQRQFDNISDRQHGGIVWPGQSFLVGERGPELFRPEMAGEIIPAGETRRLLDGGQATPITLTINMGPTTISSNVDINRIGEDLGFQVERAVGRAFATP